MLTDGGKTRRTKIAVIGGGAAGLMACGAAYDASGGSADITLFERNEKTGKKLYITGKGRCNVTNDCAPSEFLKNVVGNPKFLFGAINRFSPSDTAELLEKYGTPVKVERGNRVFPVSDHASDVIRALSAYARRGCAVRLGERVREVSAAKEGFLLKTDGGVFEADKVVVATGGITYPTTGSDGDGYAFAKSLGHNIIPPCPALVPLILEEDVSALEGLALKNVRASLSVGGKHFDRFGEMLFTADGASGPIILTLSSLAARYGCSGARLSIDLKPALDRETLDARILSDFGKFSNRLLRNSLGELLPASLIPYIIGYASLPADKPVHSVTAAERERLLRALKGLEFTVRSADGPAHAVVTSGGVDVKEIDPKTMESKLIGGLYFAGEVIDVDALTGGFNIQIALSTGYVAGLSAGGAND